MANAINSRRPAGMHTTDEVARAVDGLTRRQIDYWVRTGLITPSIGGRRGSGHLWWWSDDDLARLHIIAARLAWGMTPQAACRATDPPLPTFARATAS